jgi:hypothetical protein
MKNKAEFSEVVLVGAHVGRELSLVEVKVTGKLDMNGVGVGGTLVMDHEEFKEVVLVAAHLGSLNLSGLKVTGKIDMNRLRVDQWLDISGKAEFADIELAGAHIGGDLNLGGVKVAGKLDMNGLRVDQSVNMGDKAELADVDLTAAHVGRQLVTTGSKVTGKLDCHELEVGQQVFLDGGATFGESIDCRVAKIKGDLNLTGSKFEKNVDLSGAEIGDRLLIKSAQWSDGATLVLRNAKVGNMPALADAWPPKLDLNGLTYRSVDGAAQFLNWFARVDRYTPQAYDQLASVVQSQGNSPLATRIRYSSRERERSEETGRTWAWLTALKWVIGYGYYLHRAVYWVIGLVILGAIVLRVSGDGPRNGMPFGLAYSFDILLPIIKLRDWHYQIDLKTWARYYFYGHKIMGFVLASFLIAGLSGLTK